MFERDGANNEKPANAGDTARPRRRVCFFRLQSYGAFAPTAGLPVGGAETRARKFAVGLAQRPEYDVSFLVSDHGQPERQVISNVQVIKRRGFIDDFFDHTYRRLREFAQLSRKPPFLHIRRFHSSLCWTVPTIAYHVAVHQRLPLWLKTRRPRPQPFVRELNPDVMCCFGTNGGAAEMLASCRAYGIRSLLFLIHDWEADPAVLATQGLIREFHEYGTRMRYAVAQADVILVQTEHQRELVRQCHGREATVLHNPLDLSGAEALPAEKREFVFWVGRAEPPTISHKRPELVLELARRLPEVPFLAVMNPSDPERFQALCAAAPANLKIVESIPRDQIESYFRRAAVFINTSSHEGFPNTFLEAAKYATPVVSLTVDPDGFLQQHGGGVGCLGDFEKMVSEVSTLWNDPARREQLGAAARKYAAREYDLPTRIDQLATLIDAVCDGKGFHATAR